MIRNSVSDASFYIESEDEDEAKESERGGEEGGDGSDSDNSVADENESRQFSRPGSYSNMWPQSYRQSIDNYSNIVSPGLGFLGSPYQSAISRLSSSFRSSSLTRRHTPEILSSLIKPLLPTTNDQKQQPHERRSSHALLPPLPEKHPSKKFDVDYEPSKVSHELPISQNCSYGQAVMNGINALCGVGILSTPHALKEGGWLGLSVLIVFAVLAWYTGSLLRRCLDSEPGLETYPDIGQAAFGTIGRIVISIILYVELYACCVEYLILEGDNLASLFPNAKLSLGGLVLNSHNLFAVMTTLAVLPTVWLKDFRVLSYVSAAGVIASLLVVLCLFWAGLVDHVGFQSKGTPFNITGFPVAIGIYGFCFSGHALFPNIYSSMAKPSEYPSVLLTCFTIITLFSAGAAAMGYAMFAESTLSQFTLNMPQALVASKIAIWTTVVNPFTKYALTMAPVALSLEELLPSSHFYSIVIRTALVISTLIVGLTIPFFGLVMALIGSLLTMLVTFILPCLCFLSISMGKLTRLQGSLCIFIIILGLISSGIGTFSALSKIIQNLR